MILLLTSCSTATIGKKLIGKWKVEEAVFSTGEVLKNPDMMLIFSKSSYSVFTKGKLSFSLDYQVKKDFISHYIETYQNDRKTGERIYFRSDDRMHMELSDYLNGNKIDLKYYMSRIKEEEEE